MATVAHKSFTVLLSAAPGSKQTDWGLDVALAAAALGQTVTLILIDDAVLHLAPSTKDKTSLVDFGALHHYGIEQIHASTTALGTLEPIADQLRDDLAITWLDDAAISHLLATSKVVLSA